MLSQDTFHIFSSHLEAHDLKQCMYLFVYIKVNEAGSQRHGFSPILVV